jgi:RNA polymerase-associated protein CTR9
MQHKQSRESSTILQAACDRPGGSRDQRVRILASAGIAHLTQAADKERSLADHRFTSAGKVDTLFPMTWMGRGMLNLSMGRMDQAKFFFDTTLKQCGQVLPALLGMAAVLMGEKDYKGAQEMYAKAIRLYPEQSGAAARVGFGLSCYRLGQVSGVVVAESLIVCVSSSHSQLLFICHCRLIGPRLLLQGR